MAYLADTNILLRSLEPGTAMCSEAEHAIDVIRRAGETIWITPQVIAEFWGVATRPRAANGLGLTPADADGEVTKIEGIFRFAPDSPAIYPAWRTIVLKHSVSGTQVHDARLAAAMSVHRITHVLTFNVGDFTRFTEVTAVHPASFAATT